jgi:hypothetical protein
MMRRNSINITIAPNSFDYLEEIKNKIGSNRSEVVDLFCDMIRGNFTDEMIRFHYQKIYRAEKYDARRKES